MSTEISDALSLSNLMRPEVRANPYPLYAQLRFEDPIHWDESMGFWVLTRYADVAQVFHDARFSRAQGLQAGRDRLPEPEKEQARPVYDSFARMMTYSDPPYHTRLRGLANKAFTPRAVEQMRRLIQYIVNELLNAVQADGWMDVIRDLAQPLPILVIARLLGLPTRECLRFKQWSDDIFAVVGVVRRSPDLMGKAAASLADLSAYIAQHIERRRRSRSDLLGALVDAEEHGRRLTRDELVSNVILLLAAGHETTTNLIGNGLLALLKHPDQMRRLRDDPSLAASGVDELLRYDNPVQIVYRSPTEDVEVDGRRIGKGQLVNLVLGAANRDPAHYHEPDRLDLGRRDNRHAGFGLGIHYCLGAPLARLEGQIAITTMLRRMPKLRLEGQTLKWHESPTFRGVKSLPVAF